MNPLEVETKEVDNYFISIDKIKNTSYDELSLVVGKDAAKNIIEYFKERDAENE